MRVYNKTLHFDPYLPTEWDSYLFRVTFKNALLKVEVLDKTVTYTLVEGQSLRFIHSGHTRVTLKANKSVTLKLKDKFTDIATLEFDGIIFDMDLFTKDVETYHMQAWVATLNDFLLLRGTQDNTTYQPVTEEEYTPLKHTWVTGADRHAGLRMFLEQRGLKLAQGTSTDPPTEHTLSGLGNAKRAKFREIVSEVTITPCSDVLTLLKDLAEEGIQVGCVSYSKNCKWLLEKAGIAHLFHSIVGGQKFSSLGLRGRPDADLFYRCAEEMSTQPRRCVAVVNDIKGYGEDAFKKFKLTVARHNPPVCTADQAEPDRVIQGFEGVTTSIIEEWVTEEHSRSGFQRKPSSRFAVPQRVKSSTPANAVPTH
jgi:beta-phosphoglucomutase-like phosphatase (HAD superfamily)